MSKGHAPRGRLKARDDLHARFAAEYLVDLNATAAYLRTYANCKSVQGAGVEGCRLLRNPRVAALVAEGTARHLADTSLTATRVLEELRRLAMVDLRGFFDEDGNIKSVKDLTAEQGACLSGFEVIIKNAEAGDGVTDTVHKFKVWDKTRALEMLAKHFKLLTDVVQVETADASLAELAKGNRRASDDRQKR